MYYFSIRIKKHNPMSQRIKSSLYLAAFVIASLIYYSETDIDQTPQTVDMAKADIEQISSIDLEE